MKRHYEPPGLLYFSVFPGWLAWFSLQIFCLNNKIHFSLANANNSASFKRKMVWKWRFLLIHKQQTNLWMKLPTIPPGLAGKIVKNRPLSEPIRLQDLEDSARSQASKTKFMYRKNNLDIPGSNQGCWLRKLTNTGQPAHVHKLRDSMQGSDAFYCVSWSFFQNIKCHSYRSQKGA